MCPVSHYRLYPSTDSSVNQDTPTFSNTSTQVVLTLGRAGALCTSEGVGVGARPPQPAMPETCAALSQRTASRAGRRDRHAPAHGLARQAGTLTFRLRGRRALDAQVQGAQADLHIRRAVPWCRWLRAPRRRRIGVRTCTRKHAVTLCPGHAPQHLHAHLCSKDSRRRRGKHRSLKPLQRGEALGPTGTGPQGHVHRHTCGWMRRVAHQRATQCQRAQEKACK